MIDETRRLELLQQEEEEDEDEDEEGEVGEGEGDEKDADEQDDTTIIGSPTEKVDDSKVKDAHHEKVPKERPQVQSTHCAVVAKESEAIQVTAHGESTIEAPIQEESRKTDEKKPVRLNTETIPKSANGKEENAPAADSTFMAEVMSMFDGIASSSSSKSENGLTADNDKKSSAGTEYTDSDSEIEEGIIKRIQRTTILTSDLTISRVWNTERL